MWFIGVEVEQETSAPPPKKNPGSAPVLVRIWQNTEGNGYGTSPVFSFIFMSFCNRKFFSNLYLTGKVNTLFNILLSFSILFFFLPLRNQWASRPSFVGTVQMNSGIFSIISSVFPASVRDSFKNCCSFSPRGLEPTPRSCTIPCFFGSSGQGTWTVILKYIAMEKALVTWDTCISRRMYWPLSNEISNPAPFY